MRLKSVWSRADKVTRRALVRDLQVTGPLVLSQAGVGAKHFFTLVTRMLDLFMYSVKMDFDVF